MHSLQERAFLEAAKQLDEMRDAGYPDKEAFREAVIATLTALDQTGYGEEVKKGYIAALNNRCAAAGIDYPGAKSMDDVTAPAAQHRAQLATATGSGGTARQILNTLRGFPKRRIGMGGPG